MLPGGSRVTGTLGQGPSARVFRAVADPTRRAILDALRASQRPAGEIAARFSVSRPAISRHLRVLREARLVVETRLGRERLYALNAEPLKSVDQWLEEYRKFWGTKLTRLKQFVESRSQEKSQ